MSWHFWHILATHQNILVKEGNHGPKWPKNDILLNASSVARGGGEGGSSLPHWLVKNAKSHVFGAFEAEFWWKIENSPPKGNWVPKLWSTYRDSAEKASEFPISVEKSVSISVKTFFFFGDHLLLGGKNVWISELSEKFPLNFRTNRVILIQEQWKFWSRSFALFSLFQKSPPSLFQILATRLLNAAINLK